MWDRCFYDPSTSWEFAFEVRFSRKKKYQFKLGILLEDLGN
jgi:hypothetical protein